MLAALLLLGAGLPAIFHSPRAGFHRRLFLPLGTAFAAPRRSAPLAPAENPIIDGTPHLRFDTLGFPATEQIGSTQAPLHLAPTTITADVTRDSGLVARGLGYLVGAGSLLLYTPIAIRVYRQQDASGLTLSTWWLKLASYTCTIVYSLANHYPISTYVETVIISGEALIILALVAFYQRRLDATFAGATLAYPGR